MKNSKNTAPSRAGFKNDSFLRACRKEPTDYTPIWMMRQAGRYLPEYQALREKYDFETLYKTPELAVEITLQPVRRFDVDAAIIFSDILVVPEAMGLFLKFHEGKGPVFSQPVRSERDIRKLRRLNVAEDLDFVLKAIEWTVEELSGDIPLIGFSGSPWTLFAYMVEGQGSRTFRWAKSMLYEEPERAHRLLELLSDQIAAYLSAQIAAGAGAVQIFDSWGGLLSPDLYREFSLAYLKKVIRKLEKGNQPVIVFAKGVHGGIAGLAESGADCLSVDWTVHLGHARRLTGGKVALQGNLDPAVLYARPEVIRKEAENVLRAFGKGNGHVFNLGHGLLPDVDPDHVKILVDFVREASRPFHETP